MNVICYGDSNTYGFDPRSYWGERYSSDIRWVDRLAEKSGWSILNQGMNGRCIPTSQVTFSEEADTILIMLGTNDLLQGYSVDEVAARLEHYLQTAIDRHRYIVIAPPRMQRGEWVADHKLLQASIELSEKYMEVCESLKIPFVDTSSWNVPLCYDGVHLSEDGHRVFAEQLYYALIGGVIHD